MMMMSMTMVMVMSSRGCSHPKGLNVQSTLVPISRVIFASGLAGDIVKKGGCFVIKCLFSGGRLKFARRLKTGVGLLKIVFSARDDARSCLPRDAETSCTVADHRSIGT